jgi:hypothetical protein
MLVFLVIMAMLFGLILVLIRKLSHRSDRIE